VFTWAKNGLFEISSNKAVTAGKHCVLSDHVVILGTQRFHNDDNVNRENR
jgi:hypothetical protein